MSNDDARGADYRNNPEAFGAGVWVPGGGFVGPPGNFDAIPVQQTYPWSVLRQYSDLNARWPLRCAVTQRSKALQPRHQPTRGRFGGWATVGPPLHSGGSCTHPCC